MRRRLIVSALACALAGPLTAEVTHLSTVVQKGRAFSVPEIAVATGDTIRFTNEDGFLHQLFVHSAAFSVDSAEQKPGQDVDIRFPVAGEFHVLCAIHPKMDLSVEVR